MSIQLSDDQIAAVRGFNASIRGSSASLDQQLMKSPFSLSEARVLYELAHRDDLAAKDLGGELGLDPGYLSRILQKLDDSGFDRPQTAAVRPAAGPAQPDRQGAPGLCKLDRRLA